MIRYIYEIENRINSKTYIGKHSTNDLNDGYMGSGKLLHCAYKKYGIENFTKRILVQGEFSLAEINRFEKCMIAFQKLNNKAEYNIAKGGDGGQVFWGTGRDTAEDRRRHGIATKKGQLKKEHEDPGHWSRVARKGLITKNQHLKDGTISYKGENNGMYGKHHTEETRKRLSETHLGEKNSSFGKHWYTNGVDELKLFECPNGWWPGRLSSKYIDIAEFKKEKEEKRQELKNKKLEEQRLRKEQALIEKNTKLKRYKCIETDEVKTAKEWLTFGVKNLPRVADTNWTSCGLHFITVNTENGY